MLKFNRKHDRFSRSVFAKDILHHLRIQILSGELKAKHRLVEGQLAEEYGVSRGPVRSAIHALEQQGLVRILPSGGAEVVGFTRKHALDLFDIRLNLEEIAARTMMQLPQLETHQLRTIIDNMQKPGISIQELEHLDIEFHYELIKLADNWALLQLWETLRPVITDMLTLTNRLIPDVESIAPNHLSILNAVESRDLDLLLSLLNEQIKEPRHLMIEWFQQIEGEDGEAASGK